jgi:uncharacterized protein YaaW (UPF0174 family)
MIDYKQVENIIGLYKSILSDIKDNIKLDVHKKDVESAICEVENSINSAKAAGTLFDELEKLKNELYYLKYEILERT